MIVIFSFIACWAVVIFNFIFLNIFNTDPVGYVYLISLQVVCVVIFIYLIAFFSQKYPFLFTQKQVREKIKRKLNLTDNQTRQLENELKELMEVDRIYLEENISLAVLAEEMGVHPNVKSIPPLKTGREYKDGRKKQENIPAINEDIIIFFIPFLISTLI